MTVPLDTSLSTVDEREREKVNTRRAKGQTVRYSTNDECELDRIN